MKRVKIQKLVFICFISIPFILLMFLALSRSISKHHSLLFSTYEFIIVAKSRRVALFVMFNVIIITIFLGSSKPSAVDFDWFFHPSVVHETICCSYDDDDDDGDGYHGYDGYDEDNDDEIGTEDVDSEDEMDNDLERRVEDFIAKVNKKWREELLAERLLCITAATELSKSINSL